MNDLREHLAALCHEQWSGWMKYLYSRLSHGGLSMFDTGPARVIETPLYERWRRQMDAPYADLPDEEKESDRKEADRFIDSLETELAELTELRANAELKAFMESQMLQRFADNPDAHNWMGWRVTDDEGRQFDLTVQLVGGETLLDRLKALEETADLMRRCRDLLDVATDEDVLAFIRSEVE